MVTSDNVVMVFNTSTGRQRSIRINEPRPDLTNNDVIVTAGELGGVNLFNSDIGTLTGFVGASRVVTTTTTVF